MYCTGTSNSSIFSHYDWSLDQNHRTTLFLPFSSDTIMDWDLLNVATELLVKSHVMSMTIGQIIITQRTVTRGMLQADALKTVIHS